jgi:prophage maintenance system killer protein
MGFEYSGPSAAFGGSAPKLGPTVESNPLSMMKDINTINSQQLSLQKQQDTYQADVQNAKTQAERNAVLLQKEQALLQPEIKAKQMELQKTYFNHTSSILGGLLNDHDFINGNKDAMIEKVNHAEQYLKRLGVPVDQDSTAEQIKGQIIADPKKGYEAIKNLAQQTGGAAQQFEQLQKAQSLAIYQGEGSQQPGPQGGVSPQAMEGSPLPYPVRKAGEPYNQRPSEPVDLKKGQDFRQSLYDATQNLSTNQRNIDEVISTSRELEKQIGGGAGMMGDFLRSVNTRLGTETGQKYVQLGKDLAQAQISNMKALGQDMNTDAGRQLMGMASGKESYPPAVLIKIAERAKADSLNLQMQTNGAELFSQKFGDQNMKKFQTDWRNNADSKVFELNNVFNDQDMTGDQKKAKVKELTGGNPEKIAELKKKWKNLEKLSQTGNL